MAYARRQGSPAGSREAQGPPEFIEKVVTINRLAKVTKGGKRLSFSTLVVAGDGKGKVGWALGKANEVGDAIRKGLTQAKRSMFRVPMRQGTITHQIIGHFGASRILLKPAAPGTGVIAGGTVRAVCDAAGITDILTKSMGSDNAVNVVQATISGLSKLEIPKVMRDLRRPEGTPATVEAGTADPDASPSVEGQI